MRMNVWVPCALALGAQLGCQPMESAERAGNAADTELGESRDRGSITYYSDRDGNDELYVTDPETGDERRLTFSDFSEICPDWSPDGTRIAFLSNRDDPDPIACFPHCFQQIYLIDADGSSEPEALVTDQSAFHPDWHPDASRILFDTAERNEGDVYVVGVTGSEPRLLIEDGFWADWSPDGARIAFASNRDGNVEIYVADADGSNPERLTNNQRLDAFPAWSPDGTKIAFTAEDSTSEQEPTLQVFVMNADGTGEQQVTFYGTVNEDPAWSPDGESIVFQSNRDGNFEIYVVNLEAALRDSTGSVPNRVTDIPSGEYWPSWSWGR